MRDTHAEAGVREASLYEKLEDGKVRCGLCAHRCTIRDGRLGICQVRRNDGGILHTLVYGNLIAEHIDPIEKKPLYHFYPGSRAYSVGTPGCNFRCGWCQNSEISQIPRGRGVFLGREVAPEDVVRDAANAGCRSIAYTYTEPTIFFEYARDTARLGHDGGLANIFVTNGFMTPEMLAEMDGLLDAANVDLKAFRDETYRKQVGARLEPVLESMKTMKKMGVWLEVTTLIIPGVNDSEEEMRETAEFLAGEIGEDTPWHLSRFFPAYKAREIAPTPVETLRRTETIGREAGLRYVYLGNVGSESDTLCHACGAVLIRRSGFRCFEKRVAEGSRCSECGEPAAGVGLAGQ